MLYVTSYDVIHVISILHLIVFFLCTEVSQYFVAEMTLIGSKTVNGVRAEVYTAASSRGGFYYQDKEHSIYYNGNDLIVKIMFETSKECAQFVNDLDNRLLYFPLIQQVQIKDSFDKVIVSNVDLKYIFQRHYNTSKEENPEDYSVAITNYTHITTMTTIDFEMEMTMIESKDLSDFYGLLCYKCHLMSRLIYPAERDNPNNVLWMSWSTHQRFDGLYTINDQLVPQIAISYVDRSNKMEVFGFEERERVEIAIECENAQILGIMYDRMKAGSQMDEVKKKIYTYVYVKDAVDFQRCLTHKYNETKFVWTTRNRGEELTAEEAHILRLNARLQAKEPALV